jgi:hypothetical protein
MGIRYSGKPLGRTCAKDLTPYQQRKYRVEQGRRNEVEGKFGQGENGYNLSKIRARVARTSESWIAAIFFVINLVKFRKEFLFSSLNTVFVSIFPRQYYFVHQQIQNNEFIRKDLFTKP